ncbi:MAG: S-methyl-5-thioribose-1-phosphate isomerase, partial [Candidatus Eisenbacteria bacterium]
IASLRVRGAPAIGIAGAYGVALAAWAAATQARGVPQVRELVAAAAGRLRAVRPTAANLAWGVQRVARRHGTALDGGMAPAAAARAALEEAKALHNEDLAMSLAMGRAGLPLVAHEAKIVTHCNTGGLATGGLGTALAVVFAAAWAGRDPEVFVDETRPLLQGARLTAWELLRLGIRATLLVDAAAAALMARRRIDLVLVGADRVAANGDTANKVGTYALALAAARHRVPFYVVAPSSTFDTACPSGAEIVVEERGPEEVRTFHGHACAPPSVGVWNPAFDVTPAELIAGWVTERGVLAPPFSSLLGRENL